MKQNSTLIFGSIFICAIVFILPFLVRSDNDSLNSVFATAFTALGAFATLITMIIALSLYQKYGMDSKLIEQQTGKVFELIDQMKGKSLTIHTGEIKYFLRFINIEEDLKSDPVFNRMYPKKIAVNSDDYLLFLQPLRTFMSSYLLPTEIKTHLKLFDLYAVDKEVEFSYENYVKMSYDHKIDDSFFVIFPYVTVEEFIDRKNMLIKSIEDWLSKHTSIKLDFEMGRP
ncbi:hypothetical protein A1704_23080 [Chryseobacterium cucumeris]|uniref:hypothetical protein n=1 Tax=Chryseobacterium cucumeris TaxID=1813611 RepID=UPI0007895F18|nr:hypothetical protein [Chryseobacterium cucumeris]KYH06699.1 hypothetical protein A1704_23080 [Chryseobacterium cucumeris]